ncbi:hypothetical protein DIPPA_11342 [Diplonema papillatum]|nr:hypothetical protein DIPPA_11342 [Diplonema papillatum]
MSAVLKKAQLAAGVNNPKATPFSKNPAGAEKGGGEKPRTVLRYRLPHPMRDESCNPLRLEAGEERLYTDEELKEFEGTEYSNGKVEGKRQSLETNATLLSSLCEDTKDTTYQSLQQPRRLTR